MTKTAKDFYGSAYDRASNPAKLDDAFKWLNKAIEFEAAEGGETKLNMALKAALKAEGEAFA